MKKKILVLTALLSAGIMAGCGADNKAEYLKDISKAEEFVTIGEYKGVEVTLTEPNVTEEDVEAAIADVLTNYPMPSEVVGGSAADGLEVDIDFVGMKDGVAFEGGSSEGYRLMLGQGNFIADLEQGIIGMKKGEVKDIPVTFPEDYQSPDLAGQDAVFTVTMNGVWIYPEAAQELTDEYVAWFPYAEETTVEGFREYMKTTLQTDAQTQYDSQKSGMVTDAFIMSCTFKKLPEALLSRMETTLAKNIADYASMYGMDSTAYMVSAQMMTADQTADEVITLEAEKNAKLYLAFKAVADLEGLNISDTDLEAEIAAFAADSGTTPEEYEANLDKEAFREYLMADKVADFIMENAVVKPQ